MLVFETIYGVVKARSIRSARITRTHISLIHLGNELMLLRRTDLVNWMHAQMAHNDGVRMSL